LVSAVERMAALLKKRALAEYSLAVTQTLPPPPPKKLRLIRRKPTTAAAAAEGPGEGGGEAAVVLENEINSLDSTRTPPENFRALSRIAASLPATVTNNSL
jgi:hypothetical protein